MITPEHAVFGAVLVCLLGAVLSLVASRRPALAGWVAFATVALSSAMVMAGVARVLTLGPGEAVAFLAVPELGFAFRVYVDGLSSVFLGLIATVAVFASLYSIEYMRHQKEYGVAGYYPNFLVFVAAMYGLVSTTDMMYFFFIFWQMMTFAGFALIRFERNKPENLRAARTYLRMMQLACALTMVGAEMLASTSARLDSGETMMKYDFDAVSRHLPELIRTNSGVVTVAFGLFLAGFGIKMGMWPFGQIWLPDAHPAAPSPVSAMLSGVMIKTGVYGLMRYFLWLAPVGTAENYPLAWWGYAMALLGTVTLFTGTVQALRQDQSKRLLAYSSIGQAGYILLGLGASLALIAAPNASAAAVTLAGAAFTGALFHTVNHGVFKSLLFLNAGTVLQATGTQDLNKLGGLLRFMPVTALTGLVACCSIAGVPLFSGFASKWCLVGASVLGGGYARVLPLCAMIAIITSGLTLALFIKFFGVTFLSRTSNLVRETVGGRAKGDPGWLMQIPQLALAGLCLVGGLAPIWVLALIQQALNASQQGMGAMLATVPSVGSAPMAGLADAGIGARFIPAVFLVVLILLFLLARALSKLGGSGRRTAHPWLCGYAREADCHRYRASGYYGELQRYFAWMGGRPRPLPSNTPVKPTPGAP